MTLAIGEKQVSDNILRLGDKISRKIYERLTDGEYEITEKIITEIELPRKKQFKIKLKDIVERQLRDGDWLVFNRQPSLWAGSLRAKKIKIRPGLTFRFNPSSTEAYNAD